MVSLFGKNTVVIFARARKKQLIIYRANSLTWRKKNQHQRNFEVCTIYVQYTCLCTCYSMYAASRVDARFGRARFAKKYIAKLNHLLLLLLCNSEMILFWLRTTFLCTYNNLAMVKKSTFSCVILCVDSFVTARWDNNVKYNNNENLLL